MPPLPCTHFSYVIKTSISCWPRLRNVPFYRLLFSAFLSVVLQRIAALLVVSRVNIKWPSPFVENRILSFQSALTTGKIRRRSSRLSAGHARSQGHPRPLHVKGQDGRRSSNYYIILHPILVNLESISLTVFLINCELYSSRLRRRLFKILYCILICEILLFPET